MDESEILSQLLIQISINSLSFQEILLIMNSGCLAPILDQVSENTKSLYNAKLSRSKNSTDLANCMFSLQEDLILKVISRKYQKLFHFKQKNSDFESERDFTHYLPISGFNYITHQDHEIIFKFHDSSVFIHEKYEKFPTAGIIIQKTIAKTGDIFLISDIILIIKKITENILELKIAGKKQKLFGEGPFVIGWDSDCFISIKEESISNKHAKFELINKEWWITDLDSENKTTKCFHNFESLKGEHDSDEFQIIEPCEIRFNKLTYKAYTF